MKIAVVCPTRDRPIAFRQMYESVLDTAKEADVLAYVDNDQNYELPEECRVICHVGTRMGRGPSINLLCRENPQYDSYLLVTDDVVFTKPGWEDDVAAAMPPDGIAVVNVARERPGEDFVNWPAVSRKWIDALGWFNPPQLRRYCQDTALQALSDALGRTVYLGEDILQHKGMQVEDQKNKIAEDATNFVWFMAQDFKKCLDRLKEEMR